MQKPIVVDAKGVVIAGNGTLEAARALGWTKIDVVWSKLKGAEGVAYAIADNRTAELAEWDDKELAAVLEALQADESIDELVTGFSAEEIAELIAGDAEVVEDEVPEAPVEAFTKPGDLWVLGVHRVLCGDSTKGEDVGRLMDGATADLVFTDPPYGVHYQSNMRVRSAKFDTIENDDTILDGWVPHAIAHSLGWVFVWTTWKVVERWIPVVQPFGELSNMVIWNKGGGGMGDLAKTFSTDYEIALVFHRGADLQGKRIGSVWSFNKDAAGSYVHPTQKPVALAAEATDKTTCKGALVMDLFLGSGTTLIAAEQLGRKCYGIEIEPRYCDVICKRWMKLTGRYPVRESDGVEFPAEVCDAPTV